MEKFIDTARPTRLPPLIPFSSYEDADAAVDRLLEIYRRNTAFIRDAFREYCANGLETGQRVRACCSVATSQSSSWGHRRMPSRAYVKAGWLIPWSAAA